MNALAATSNVQRSLELQTQQEGKWVAPLTDRQFDFLRELAFKQAGIVIADFKRNMLYRRVSKRLRALGLGDVAEYCEILSSEKGDEELEFFVNAMTTNKTSFFREEHHFDHMESTAIPALVEKARQSGGRRIRIWSAGCSSGEEPYSIAMTLHEALRNAGKWDAKILATDIDTDMVEAGQQGVYPARSAGDIPANLHAKYLTYSDVGEGEIQMAASLQSSIVFNQLNLLEAWPMNGPFDLIFCRNVVIYFDRPTQCELFDRFAGMLRTGSFLYIGHSESLFGVSDRFRVVGKSIYQKIA